MIKNSLLHKHLTPISLDLEKMGRANFTQVLEVGQQRPLRVPLTSRVPVETELGGRWHHLEGAGKWTEAKTIDTVAKNPDQKTEAKS